MTSTNYAISFVDGTLTVQKATTSTSLATSASSVAVGQLVTFTAIIGVVAPGSGTPTGTVTFYDGATPLGTVAVANGQAKFGTSTLSTGSHTIKVVFSGDLPP